MNLNKNVLNEKEYIVNTRRYLHKHPELSLKEYNTCKFIEEQLDSMGIEHTRVGETGVIGFINKDKPGKVIAIRADIDALAIQDLKDGCAYKSETDGVMHACGHDSHTATLLGVAKILKAQESLLSGSIRLIFQQSEENGQGARQFVSAGYLKGVDRVIGYHCSSEIPVGKVSATAGPNNASCDYFKITVKGRSAHVSTPHKSVDALFIGATIVVELQNIVARYVNPIDTVVVGVGVLKSGTTYNIISDETIIEGTTRTFSFETRDKVNGLVEKIATDISELYGATCEVQFDSYAKPLINDEEVSKEVASICNDIIGTENVILNQEKRLGADDFADFLNETKGCYFFVGSKGDNPNTQVAHHHGDFDIDEDSMLIAGSVFVDYVNWYLNNPIK